MSKRGQELVEAMKEVLAHMNGEKVPGMRVHHIMVPDVRAIRARLHLSQNQFARDYKIPLATLKGWEQGRRVPDATAASYLNVIAKLPKETKAALHAKN